jgi:tRNA (mo5U34)-methyltransferase
MDDVELRARIETTVWFQRFPIRGIMTPGRHPIDLHLRRVRLPDDLAGLRVLDVGCNDGALAFEAERRGAREVFGLDHPTWGFAGQPLPPRREAFDLARQALDSRVVPIVRDVDLEGFPAEWQGAFDVVLLLGVLYHCKNFLGVLEGCASLLAPGGLLIVETHVSALDLSYPAAKLYPNRELLGDPTNYNGMNPVAVLGFLSRFGLEPDQVGPVYPCETGNHRAVFHARRPSLAPVDTAAASG